MTTTQEKPTKEKTHQEFMQELRQNREEIEDFLKINGIEYKLDEWLTIARYAERFNISSTSIISNWIRRGVIPPENIREVEELNGLRLIKAVPYRE